TGINLFNDNGKLRKEVYQILEQVKNAGIILATGHFSFPEVESLSKAAYEMNFDKILVNHPGIIFQRFSVEQQKELLKYGAFLEHSYCRPPHTLPVDELVHTLRQLDTEKIVLATDLGQPQNPDPVDGMEELISQLVRNGFTKSEIDQMVIENPAYLLCK
ncbi:MAG TPA: DUF6282 family protein, partial [Draconibacterium sp.]|nr:DUF6282 family protein [Draconibacterium sp.]